MTGLDRRQLTALAALDAGKLANVFEVFVDGGGVEAPAMAGTTSFDKGWLTFVPRYPLVPGVRYRAVFHAARLGNGGARDVTREFDVAAPAAGPATVVEHIYPSGERLPENQLKFYLHFSAPMSRGEAYQRIRLLDEGGRKVEAAFLELGEELWDPAMQRFTLLCDPGRVKRELVPREELGPVLEAGKRYTLVVDRDWPDAAGRPLAAEARKKFAAGPPDETPLDPAAWQIEPPKAGGRGDVVVRFAEPLDHSLAERLLWVANAAGERVLGTIEVLDNETAWRFTPREPWRAGTYQLVADVALEDLAGNAVGRPFDADLVRPVQQRIETETVTVPFVVD